MLRSHGGWPRARAARWLVAVVAMVLGSVATAPTVSGLAPNGSLSGRVTSGVTGLSPMHVWLYAVPSGSWVKATTTDASGNYSFPSLTPGTYRVQAWSPTNTYPTTWFQQGTTFVTADNVVVPSGAAAPPADINVATTGSMSGTTRHNGIGVANVSTLITRVSDGVLVASSATNGSGGYAFNAIAPGDYRVAYIDPSGQFPAAGFYAEQPDVGSATIVTVTAGGTVVADQNLYWPSEQPVPPYTGNATGPKVAIVGDSITQLSSHAIHLAVDAAAAVSVRGISLQRIGQLQPVAEKFALTAPDQVIIAAGTNDAIQATPLAQSQADLVAMISSFPAASCITVEMLNTNTANATYGARMEAINAFIRSLPATYPQVQIADWQQVRAAYFAQGEPDGAWTTDGIHLTPLGQARFADLMAAAVDGCQAPRASVAGMAFGDQNANGVLDGGESPLANIPFTITGRDRLSNTVARTVMTAADGSWTFTNLVAGTYTVGETVPPELALPIITIGTTGGSEISAAVEGIVLAPGADGTGYRFGNPLAPASVYGVVYGDIDADGQRDLGEPGIDRVALSIDGLAANGDLVHLSILSAADGTWSFRGLNPGTYSITEQQPNGFAGASTTVGTSFGGVAQSHSIVGLTVTANGVGTGYLFGEVPVPAVQWAKRVQSSIITVARSVAADSAGNSYVTGAFFGASTFGAGANAVTLTSVGGTDIYLAKYDSSGELVWARRAGGAGDDEALKVAINASNVLVVSGDFNGSATFGAGAAAVTLDGVEDAFVAEYGANGSLLWVRQVEGATRSVGASAAIDDAGHVYLTGWYISAASFSGTPVSGTGAASAFVARYLPDGTFDWVRSPSSPFGSLGFDIAVDAAGNAYVGGAHGGIDFGDGSPYTTAGALDAFVAKYHPDGTVGFTRSFAGIGNDIVFGVAVDAAAGEVYVSGTFAWTVDFGAGEVLTSVGLSEAFVARLATNGATVWARSISSTGDDMAARLSVRGGRVNITGSYGAAVSIGSIELLAYGTGDAFAASYDVNGNAVWARPIAGAGGDGGWGTATLASGDVIVIGVFALQAAVMPGPVEIGITGGIFPTQFLARLYA